MKGVPFEVDDKILSRDPNGVLMHATYTGTKFVGSLVKQGISYQKGYTVLFSGPVDSVISQTGYPTVRYPREIQLYSGWNNIGVSCLSITLTRTRSLTPTQSNPSPNPNPTP